MNIHTLLSDVLSDIRRAIPYDSFNPKTCIILGSGISLSDEFDMSKQIKVSQIKNYPKPSYPKTALDPSIVFGTYKGQDILIFTGKYFMYEGLTAKEVAFPVYLAHKFGCENLIITGASGNLRQSWHSPDVMVITDHINLLGDNPCVGEPYNEDNRYPDLSKVYNKKWRNKLRKLYKNKLNVGIYCGMLGPTLETASEYRMLWDMKVSAIGMSVVAEALVGAECGMRTLGIVSLTDDCNFDNLKKMSIATIIKASNKVAPRISKMIEDGLDILYEAHYK